MTILKVRNLTAGYGAVGVLWDISFELEVGQVMAVIGSNGAGKTTLLRAISGVISYQGEVDFEPTQKKTAATHALARAGMGHVPENRGTFEQLSVEENLTLGSFSRRRDKVSERAQKEMIYTFFPRLRERRFQQAGTLSGGEQQMLAIGRALSLKPKLLLLDEPSFGLSPHFVEEIYAILALLKRDHQTAMLLVEQHASIALQLADNALVLASGRTFMQGTSAEIQADERVRGLYLGVEA